MNQTFLWVDLYYFNQSYSVGITKKPTGYWRYHHHSRCWPPRCQWAAMEPGVHTMSDELILQISCNIFLAFKWILMMTSGQNMSHYTTAKLSVHVWNHALIWWQNKIDTQKHFRETTTTSSWTLSKTKIPITIVKAQMPSNPNQKSRTRDNKKNPPGSCHRASPCKLSNKIVKRWDVWATRTAASDDSYPHGLNQWAKC